MNAEEREAFQLMLDIGGSFAKALANAAFLADLHNLDLIRATWPGLIEEYKRMAGLRGIAK